MITVVSLNPSIDRTLMLAEFHAGQTNRVRQSRSDAGGKGVNVCLHLRALGAEEVRCAGLMRAEDEARFRSRLEAAGVPCDWLTMPGRVRVNTKICADDGGLTELNESGEAVPPDVLPALLERCGRLFARSRVAVLTGSVPPGLPMDVYARLIRLAHEAGATCLLDADGAALSEGLKARPDAVKPNRAELERLLGEALPDVRSLLRAAQKLLDRGVLSACVSLGARGAVYATRSRLLMADAVPVDVRSTVGAGDAMVAGLALAAERNLPDERAFSLAVAAGTAAVCTEGTQMLRAEDFRRALPQVRLREGKGEATWHCSNR